MNSFTVKLTNQITIKNKIKKKPLQERDWWWFGKAESESERGREKYSESERRKDERLREYERGRESRDLVVSDERGN